MQLVKCTTITDSGEHSNELGYVHNLRQPNKILGPDQIKTGEYYLYKEKFGMVCVVKAIGITIEDGWMGFRFMVKRTLYSSWHVPKGTVFDVGYQVNLRHNNSWHIEPCLSLLKPA